MGVAVSCCCSLGWIALADPQRFRSNFAELLLNRRLVSSPILHTVPLLYSPDDPLDHICTSAVVLSPFRPAPVAVSPFLVLSNPPSRNRIVVYHHGEIRESLVISTRLLHGPTSARNISRRRAADRSCFSDATNSSSKSIELLDNQKQH